MGALSSCIREGAPPPPVMHFTERNHGNLFMARPLLKDVFPSCDDALFAQVYAAYCNGFVRHFDCTLHKCATRQEFYDVYVTAITDRLADPASGTDPFLLPTVVFNRKDTKQKDRDGRDSAVLQPAVLGGGGGGPVSQGDDWRFFGMIHWRDVDRHGRRPSGLAGIGRGGCLQILKDDDLSSDWSGKVLLFMGTLLLNWSWRNGGGRELIDPPLSIDNVGSVDAVYLSIHRALRVAAHRTAPAIYSINGRDRLLDRHPSRVATLDSITGYILSFLGVWHLTAKTQTSNDACIGFMAYVARTVGVLENGAARLRPRNDTGYSMGQLPRSIVPTPEAPAGGSPMFDIPCPREWWADVGGGGGEEAPLKDDVTLIRQLRKTREYQLWALRALRAHGVPVPREDTWADTFALPTDPGASTSNYGKEEQKKRKCLEASVNLIGVIIHRRDDHGSPLARPRITGWVKPFMREIDLYFTAPQLQEAVLHVHRAFKATEPYLVDGSSVEFYRGKFPPRKKPEDGQKIIEEYLKGMIPKQMFNAKRAEYLEQLARDGGAAAADGGASTPLSISDDAAHTSGHLPLYHVGSSLSLSDASVHLRQPSLGLCASAANSSFGGGSSWGGGATTAVPAACPMNSNLTLPHTAHSQSQFESLHSLNLTQPFNSSFGSNMSAASGMSVGGTGGRGGPRATGTNIGSPREGGVSLQLHPQPQPRGCCRSSSNSNSNSSHHHGHNGGVGTARHMNDSFEAAGASRASLAAILTGGVGVGTPTAPSLTGGGNAGTRRSKRREAADVAIAAAAAPHNASYAPAVQCGVPRATGRGKAHEALGYMPHAPAVPAGAGFPTGQNPTSGTMVKEKRRKKQQSLDTEHPATGAASYGGYEGAPDAEMGTGANTAAVGQPVGALVAGVVRPQSKYHAAASGGGRSSTLDPTEVMQQLTTTYGDALIGAALTGQVGITKHLLVDCGIPVNTRYTNDWTPLHYAAAAGQVDVVDALLAAGADAGLATSEGVVAAKLAEQRGHARVEQLLRRVAETTNGTPVGAGRGFAGVPTSTYGIPAGMACRMNAAAALLPHGSTTSRPAAPPPVVDASATRLCVFGSPGVGKSTVLNALLGAVRFPSGVVYTERSVTTARDAHVSGVYGCTLVDTPGYTPHTLAEITSAMRECGRCRMLFVVRAQSGRASEDDVHAVRVMLEAFNQPVSYGIVVNKVGRRMLSDFERIPKMRAQFEERFGDTLVAGGTGNANVSNSSSGTTTRPTLFIYLQHTPALDDVDNQVPPPPTPALLAHLKALPVNRVDGAAVVALGHARNSRGARGGACARDIAPQAAWPRALRGHNQHHQHEGGAPQHAAVAATTARANQSSDAGAAWQEQQPRQHHDARGMGSHDDRGGGACTGYVNEVPVGEPRLRQPSGPAWPPAQANSVVVGAPPPSSNGDAAAHVISDVFKPPPASTADTLTAALSLYNICTPLLPNVTKLPLDVREGDGHFDRDTLGALLKKLKEDPSP